MDLGPFEKFLKDMDGELSELDKLSPDDKAEIKGKLAILERLHNKFSSDAQHDHPGHKQTVWGANADVFAWSSLATLLKDGGTASIEKFGRENMLVVSLDEIAAWLSALLFQHYVTSLYLGRHPEQHQEIENAMKAIAPDYEPLRKILFDLGDSGGDKA